MARSATWASSRPIAVHVSSGSHSNTNVGVVTSRDAGWVVVVGETEGIAMVGVEGGWVSTHNGSKKSLLEKKKADNFIGRGGTTHFEAMAAM